MFHLFKRHDVLSTYLMLTGLLAVELWLRSMSWGDHPVAFGLGVPDLIEWAMAAILVVWLVWRYWYFLPHFYRFCLVYPGLALILAILYALVYGLLGTGFGVHYQFWHDVVLTRVGASCAATLTLGIIGMLAYYVDPKPAWTAALIDDALGGPDPRLSTAAAGVPPGGPGFFRLRSPNVIRLSRFLRFCRWAFLSLLAAPALLPAVFTTLPTMAPMLSVPGPMLTPGPHHADVLSDPEGRAFGIATWVLGIVLGVLIVKVLCWAGERTRSAVDRFGERKLLQALWNVPGRIEAKLRDAFGRRPSGFEARSHPACYYRNLPAPTCPVGPCPVSAAVEEDASLERCEEHKDFRAAVVNFYFVFLFFYLFVLNLPVFYERILSAAFSICALLSLLAMTYTWFARFYARWRFPTLLLIVAWVVVWNDDPYKFRFEKMDAYYDYGPQALRSEVRQFREEARQGAAEVKVGGLIPNEIARENWLEQAKKLLANAPSTARPGASEKKPKLAVVAVSGGATRAGYWAGVVLKRLEDEFRKDDLGDFGRSVRIITGSSGGMLGTSYYVLHRVEQAPPEAGRPELKDEQGRPIKPLGAGWVDRIPRDSLSPVAKYIAMREPWKLFLPRLWYDDDRGIRLERDWPHLRFPLKALAPLEEAGYIPSLIFSPMTIEDGRQLLISNLDLRVPPVEAGESFARWVGMASGSALTSGSPGEPQDLYSISGLEFFRLFPKAQGFLVSTAVRMSASFPYVSPAVNLPTRPPHRVVDAGYYDNYGIQTAAAWICDNREWLMANTSGIVLIQIRDSTSVVDRIGIDDRPETIWQRMGHAFQFLTSPIEGFNRARVMSGSFRNDQAIQHLSDLFTHEMQSKMPAGQGRRFFTTLVLENAAEVTSSPHPEEWPGLEYTREEPGGTADPGRSAKVRDRRERSTGVSMTWYLTHAEREALDFSIPVPAAGSDATRPGWRKIHLDRLWKAISEMGPDDPGRTHAVSDFQRVSNYEKVQQLKDWWRRGVQDAGPALPPVPAPPQ